MYQCFSNFLLTDFLFLNQLFTIPELLRHEYFYGKQTYMQLSQKYGCSNRTILSFWLFAFKM